MRSELADPIRLYQGSTLTNLVAERLEQKVVSGELVAGERLNEVALAAELGVSRGPVRESLRILERKGLVTVVANRGAFVRSIEFEDMLDLYRVRGAMTGLACELAAEHADVAVLERLQALVDQMDAAADAQNQNAYYDLNLAFHDQLVKSCGSARVASFSEQLVTQAHLFRRGSLARVTDMRQSNREHRQIVEAIGAGDSARARELGILHVNAGRERFMHAKRQIDAQQPVRPK